MTITKQGNRDKIVFGFVCPACGCEYNAPVEECEKQEDWATDGFAVVLACPCCGLPNNGRVQAHGR